MTTPDPANPTAGTRLARAVGLSTRHSRGLTLPEEHERSRRGSWLRDVILGGQDGLVNVLGIALGLTAATNNVQVLIAAGLAATFTESISMGAVAYTSTLAERDHYRAVAQQEHEHVSEDPQAEREEIRRLYLEKGFEGELLDRVVETITANRDAWVGALVTDELQLQPVETRAVLRTSVIVTIACLVGSLLPLLPFMLVSRGPAIGLSIGLSAITLFLVGVYEAKSMIGDWRRSGLKMAAIGLGAAFIGFLVGRIFHTAGG